MKNLALSRIRAMTPYEPPLGGRSLYDGLLLDFNERTVAPAATAVIGNRPQLYPEYFDLTARIAAYVGVRKDQIMITNGTDQAIDIIFRTFADRDDGVIIPEPTFTMYRQYAQINGNRIVSPLYESTRLTYPINEVLQAIDDSVKLVVICNPNNPTGTLATKVNIVQIAQKAKNAIVYIDEAYFEFSKVTATELIDEYPNIIVSRTFSKAFGLAGLRIGYIVAQPMYIKELLKVRGPYDVNQVAARAAFTALESLDDTKRYVKEVMNKAKPIVESFFEQNGIIFYPSSGNFVLFKPVNARQVANTLRQNGILVRPQNKPNIEDTLRLTVGTTEQMRRFIEVYKGKILRPKQKYAFLDRDGTLIFEPQDTYQVDSLSKLRILDGAVNGLKKLLAQGYKLVLVSNQDGLGTDTFPLADFKAPQTAMLQIFEKAGVTFEQIFICPHLPVDNCNCRKPKTGLLDEWLQTTAIDTRRSFVCGDRETDQALANNLGLPFVTIDTNGNFSEAINTYLERNPS
jgi:histidinol-phosphate aminotransferase